VLDAEAQRLDLDIPPRELADRLAAMPAAQPRYRRGYGQLFIDHVMQANKGCDFDFLRHLDGEESQREPYGLLSGWIGGW
jgi:dihydroxy-acid dehydratase